MPTYEYRCLDCNKEFTVVATITEHDKTPSPACPNCNSKNVHQLFTSVNVQTSKKS